MWLRSERGARGRHRIALTAAVCQDNCVKQLAHYTVNCLIVESRKCLRVTLSNFAKWSEIMAPLLRSRVDKLEADKVFGLKAWQSRVCPMCQFTKGYLWFLPVWRPLFLNKDPDYTAISYGSLRGLWNLTFWRPSTAEKAELKSQKTWIKTGPIQLQWIVEFNPWNPLMKGENVAK